MQEVNHSLRMRYGITDFKKTVTNKLFVSFNSVIAAEEFSNWASYKTKHIVLNKLRSKNIYVVVLQLTTTTH